MKVRLRFKGRAALDLADYLRAYQAANGQPIEAEPLVLHIVQAFIDGDRGFQAWRKSNPPTAPTWPWRCSGRTSAKRRAHLRPKYACRSCEAVHQAPMPSRPTERGRPGPGLLAQVLVAKYDDHLPLYRQSEIYAREGVELERSTLADWVGRSAALLKSLADAVGAHVMAASKLHADDTPIPVLEPGRGRTKTGRLWVYVRDDRPSGSAEPPAAFYRYSPDRKGERPREHLARFTGVLQADAYAGFGQLYATNRIAEAACWAHARRKVFEVHEATASPIAEAALGRIAALYEIEQRARGRPPDERLDLRQAEAAPRLAELRTWLDQQRARLPAKSKLASALRYSLSRWDALTRYAHDGRLEIDNNAAERALRGVAVGRKNYLFPRRRLVTAVFRPRRTRVAARRGGCWGGG